MTFSKSNPVGLKSDNRRIANVYHLSRILLFLSNHIYSNKTRLKEIVVVCKLKSALLFLESVGLIKSMKKRSVRIYFLPKYENLVKTQIRREVKNER